MTLPLTSADLQADDAFSSGLDAIPVDDLGEAAGFRTTVLDEDGNEIPVEGEITNPRSK